MVLVKVCDLDEICDHSHIARTQICVTKAHRDDRYNVPSAHQDCQKVSQILAHIGEKWSMLVVMLLRDGPRRFNDIKRNTAGISQQMLTRTLRGLERDGIVTRTILPTSPPQVEYSLTELRHSMSEPVLAFGQWVRGHLAEFDPARVRYDQRNGVLDERP
jgi:DNA-binding HxlR family transcriptional regulator